MADPLYCWLECPVCHELTQRAKVERVGGEVGICLYNGASCGHETTEAQDDVLEAAAYQLWKEAADADLS